MDWGILVIIATLPRTFTLPFKLTLVVCRGGVAKGKVLEMKERCRIISASFFCSYRTIFSSMNFTP